MGLKPGRRLGPYEIEASLGAGGMGEVYRARDTRLDRSVAIKVLPSHLAENAQRRERFEREAKAVSALSHPHICALFDVGEEDGGSLLFVSDRGGTMNVWRVPIDPETGGAGGEPVPVGAPAEDVAWLSAASAEGGLAYDSRSAVHFLYSLPIDPERLRPAGALPVSYTHPSPDGTAIAMTTRGTREDLYVLGGDGGDLRQLTNDPFRDRGPQWSPDGSEIAFYSNRSGTYQLWSIRADGSGLRRLTEVAGGAWFPYWSPDSTRIAFPTGQATCIFTVADTPVSATECLPDLSDEHWFEVRDWSPDGRWLVGNRARRTGQVLPDLLLWSFEASEYQPVEGNSLVARWMPDSRHIALLGEAGQPVLVDRTSGSVRGLGSHEVSGVVDSERLEVSRDGRTVLLRSDTLESNVWLLSFPEEPSEDPS